MPRSRTMPPQRACKMSAFHSTMMRAPFSLGSQPQNRPHDWSAQIPPNTVPTKLNSVAKHRMPYTMRDRLLPMSAFITFVKNPSTTYKMARKPAT